MESKIDSLRGRIRDFVLKAIRFARKIPRDEVSKVFVNQLLRSATSIGANYEEATEAQSNADLIHKLSVCKKEAKETKYWIELTRDSYQILENDAKLLEEEVSVLTRIFHSIITKKKIEH